MKPEASAAMAWNRKRRPGVPERRSLLWVNARSGYAA
jgi:hypothetical protein